MIRIRSVLTSPRSVPDKQIPVWLVNQWMEELRGIPYSYHEQWETPREVQLNEAGDCKGKALALYRKMKANGARQLRLVIGQRRKDSRWTHAWVVWQVRNETYLLDPTLCWFALRAADIGESFYVPHYAFSENRKFRSTALGLIARN